MILYTRLLWHHPCGERKKYLETKWMLVNWEIIANIVVPLYRGFVYMRDLRDTWKAKHQLDWCVDHARIHVGGFKQRWISFEPPYLGSHRKPWSPRSWYHRAQPWVPGRPELHHVGSGRAVPDSSLKLPKQSALVLLSPEAQGEDRTSLNRFRDVISGFRQSCCWLRKFLFSSGTERQGWDGPFQATWPLLPVIPPEYCEPWEHTEKGTQFPPLGRWGGRKLHAFKGINSGMFAFIKKKKKVSLAQKPQGFLESQLRIQMSRW